MKKLFCDSCGSEVERLWTFDNEELCPDCYAVRAKGNVLAQYYEPYTERERQMLRAHRALSAAHQHEWATVDVVEGVIDADHDSLGDCLDAIEEAVVRARPTAVIEGIRRPYYDVWRKIFSHTTGTGRLTWDIGHDGADPVVTITVSRPGNRDVLYAIAEYVEPPDGDYVDVEYVWEGGAFMPRHLEALEGAVRATRINGASVWYGAKAAPYSFREAAYAFKAAEVTEEMARERAEKLLRR